MLQVTEESNAIRDEEQLPCSKVTSDNPEAAILTWDGPDDPCNPFNWPLRRKWLATGLGLFATLLVLPNGSIITVAHEEINEAFGVSDASFPNSYWPVTSWGLGGALFSLVLLPIMEDFGIRLVFLVTYFFLIVFLIPVGLAQNFATLIAVRFFSGGCVAILGNSVASIISNVFQGDRARTGPTSLYITLYLAASSVGPVIGALILQYLSWRWIGYIELIWTTAAFPLFIVALPETRGSAILRARAQKLRKEGKNTFTQDELDKIPLWRIVLKSVQRPMYMLCTESVAFVCTLWTGFSVGTIYLFTQSVEQVMAELYGWNAVQAGYVQVAIVIGELSAWFFCYFTHRWYHDSAARNKEVPNTPIPEARLYQAIAGGFFGVTGGMFVYAWTSYPWMPWIAPSIGLAMVGFGSTAILVSLTNYVVDAYSKYAGSAIAACILGEDVSVAFLPFAAQSMYSNLGFQWASSLLAFISLLLAATPIVVLIWGKEIRARSPFMSEATDDKTVESVDESPVVG
ncbi:multidrug resistant [Fusarium albosuccineum]|uniref:Multidrug resistant n=1 Tax=Fusarium albosuccineum TaxID=1237068 RepID=A0A8H4L3T1_9HYPO|nr:multidrug resistant [Fusarium albosuccineum]